MTLNSNEELIADLVAQKTNKVEELRDKAKFTLGILQKRIEKLVRRQERLEVEVGEDMVMGKAEMMDTKRKINDLYREISETSKRKSINEEEFEHLKIRLESIDAILPTENLDNN